MINAIDTDYLKKVQIAAGMQAGFTSPSLFQLIGQRKIVAQDLLRADEASKGYTDRMELFNYLNDQIRLVLGYLMPYNDGMYMKRC